MTDVLDKMKEQVEDISDSITAVRSQVVTLNNEDENKSFTVSELIKYIDILMKNTLKEYLIVLQFTVRIPKSFEIKGNLNALVQAVDNLIMNSIESYHGKTNQTIEIILEKKNDKIEISVTDTGSGIPKRIQDKIFKEIITKEGTDKVGLGLFMAYSNIKAGFNRRHCLRIKIQTGFKIYNFVTTLKIYQKIYNVLSAPPNYAQSIGFNDLKSKILKSNILYACRSPQRSLVRTYISFADKNLNLK